MFDISDKELQGLEAREDRRRAGAPEPGAFTPIPGYGGFGEDVAPAPAPPLPAPALAPLPSSGGGGSLALGAGKALLYATLAGVAGAVAAGAWGAACGVTAAGALRNLVRTKALMSSTNPGDRSEAGKSATMGIFGLGIAGMIGYHAYTIREDGGDKESFPW